MGCCQSGPGAVENDDMTQLGQQSSGGTDATYLSFPEIKSTDRGSSSSDPGVSAAAPSRPPSALPQRMWSSRKRQKEPYKPMLAEGESGINKEAQQKEALEQPLACYGDLVSTYGDTV